MSTMDFKHYDDIGYYVNKLKENIRDETRFNSRKSHLQQLLHNFNTNYPEQLRENSNEWMFADMHAINRTALSYGLRVPFLSEEFSNDQKDERVIYLCKLYNVANQYYRLLIG